MNLEESEEIRVGELGEKDSGAIVGELLGVDVEEGEFAFCFLLYGDRELDSALGDEDELRNLLFFPL